MGICDECLVNFDKVEAVWLLQIVIISLASLVHKNFTLHNQVIDLQVNDFNSSFESKMV